MNEFEKFIETTFEPYAEQGLASCMMMPVPNKVIRLKGKPPMIIHTKKAPFDVIGYLHRDGTMVGAELKQSKHKPSISIVAPDAKGDGVQYHQLLALAELAYCGGIARLLWSNDGNIGVIRGKDLVEILKTYQTALHSKRSGRRPKRGAMSIPWDRFSPVAPAEGGVVVDWIRPI